MNSKETMEMRDLLLSSNNKPSAQKAQIYGQLLAKLGINPGAIEGGLREIRAHLAKEIDSQHRLAVIREKGLVAGSKITCLNGWERVIKRINPDGILVVTRLDNGKSSAMDPASAKLIE